MFALRSFVFLCALLLSSGVDAFLYRRDLPYLNVSRSTLPAATTIAPINITATRSSVSSTTPKPPYPIAGTGTGLTEHYGHPNSTDQGVALSQSASRNVSSNGTSIASCTINIPNAKIDWWYAATYAHPTGTLTPIPGNNSQGAKYLTTVPNTATFDVTSALKDLAYVEVVTYDSEWDVAWTYFEEYLVTPTAAATSVITRSGRPYPTDGVVPSTDAYLYIAITDRPPATAAIAAANQTAFVATSTTPVLYFSAYEVESAIPSTGPDGLVNTVTVTETVALPNPQAYPYWLKGVENAATATGTVPEEFLQQIPQSRCDGGQVQAVVTVLVVVDLYLYMRPNANPFIVHIESTALGFEEEPTRVLIQDTRKATGQPLTLIMPGIMQTATGFATTEEIMAPAGATPPPSTASGDNQHANGSPAQGPNGAEPTQTTVGTIGGNPVVIGPSSVVVVGTQTLTAGAPAVTVGGVPVSLVPSGTAVVVGGATSGLPQVAVPTARPQPPPILTIGSSTLTPNAATQFFVSPGQTLTPGGTATVGGTVVSLDPSASFIVIGGSTQIIPTAAVPVVTPRPEIVLGGSTFTANPGSTFVIAGQTLTPGQAVTVDGTTVSLAPSASFVVVNGATSTINTPPAPQILPPQIVVGGSTITANARSTFVVSGQTLVPGQVITVDGTTISLAPSASFLVINGATSTLTNPAAHITPPPLTVGNGVFTAQPGTGTSYIIGGQTLTPGGVITVAGATISLAPDATAIVVNGQTTILTPQNPSPITNPPLLTIGSETFTAAPGTGTTFIIHGQTLTPGGTITVDGTTISLAPGATQLVYGSSGQTTTTMLFPATTTRSQVITTTNEAKAGATGGPNPPAATNTPGAASFVRLPKLESCLLSFIFGLFSII